MSRVAALSAGWAHRYGGWTVPRPGPFGGGRAPVVFAPGIPLQLRVYLALGADLTVNPSTWTWTDVTEYVRYEQGITTSTGRADEASRVTPGSAHLTIDNRDGRFSRHNPTGPYYGRLSKNTPILITINPGNVAYTAAKMFVNSWPARWDKTATDFTIGIECGGILRRLNQSKAVPKSALYRTIQDSDPIAWWPLESGDERATNSTPSGLDGGVAMTAEHATAGTHIRTGTVGGNVTGPVGASRAIDLSTGGQLRGPTGISSDTDPWRFEMGFLFTEVVGASETGQIFRLNFGISNVGVFAKSTSGAETQITFTDGTTTVTATTSLIIDDGQWHHVRLDCQSSGGGANTAYQLYIDNTSILTGTATGIAFTNVVSVAISPTGDMDSASHAAVWSASTLPSSSYTAFTGHTGETAVERIERMCGEESVQIMIHSGIRESAALGPQSPGTFLDVLREAEAADNGVLYEDGWGLGYQALAARYNAPVSMALNFSTGDIAKEPEPVDDDQKLRNLWSVTRTGGGTFVVSDSSSISTNGTYDESVTVAVEADSQAEQLAAWLVHLGTDNDSRWPTLGLNFANNDGRALIQAWTELPYGARLTLDNAPSQFTPELIDVFVEGKSERFTGLEWTVDLNTTPAGPYTVGELDHDLYGRLSPADDDAELDTDITDSATSIDVARLDSTNPLWTTDATEFPFDIRVGGERMTVTSISGSSSPQTFTVTRSVNGVVKSHSLGTAVELWTPFILTL